MQTPSNNNLLKGYLIYKFGRQILALLGFGAVMIAALLPALIDLYTRYVVRGIPFPN